MAYEEEESSEGNMPAARLRKTACSFRVKGRGRADSFSSPDYINDNAAAFDDIPLRLFKEERYE